MKKADLLRLMASILYVGTYGKPAPDDYIDNREFACDSAEKIYDTFNIYDPNTDQYDKGNDPEYEKTHKLAQKLVDKIKKEKEIDDLDPDDLPF